MPIDIETFEEGSVEGFGGGASQPERVLAFLVQNADKAYRPSTIAEELSIPVNSIHPVLSRLEERNLVRHKGRYWAITEDRERLQSLTRYELVTESMNALYGEEDLNEWIDHMPDEEEFER